MQLFEINFFLCVSAVRMQNIQYLELVNVKASYTDARIIDIKSDPDRTLYKKRIRIRSKNVYPNDQNCTFSKAEYIWVLGL